MTTDTGRKYAKAIFANVGVDVAIGYGVFLVLALFVSLISAGGFIDAKVTLADLLGGDRARAAFGGGSGKGTFLVLFAAATVAVPYIWRHKFAPLAFAVPLLFTAIGVLPLYRQQRQQQEAIEALGDFGQMIGRAAQQMGGNMGGPLDNLGIGAWLLFATVIFLAFRGVMRFLATSSSAS